MTLRTLPYRLTVCKVSNMVEINMEADIFFLGKTEEEISLVCRTEDTPASAIEREDGWRGLRIAGVLDFSLIGILSGITGILADNRIGVFAISTFNTDYLLVKDKDLKRALTALEEAGYTIERG